MSSAHAAVAEGGEAAAKLEGGELGCGLGGAASCSGKGGVRLGGLVCGLVCGLGCAGRRRAGSAELALSRHRGRRTAAPAAVAWWGGAVRLLRGGMASPTTGSPSTARQAFQGKVRAMAAFKGGMLQSWEDTEIEALPAHLVRSNAVKLGPLDMVRAAALVAAPCVSLFLLLRAWLERADDLSFTVASVQSAWSLRS